MRRLAIVAAALLFASSNAYALFSAADPGVIKGGPYISAGPAQYAVSLSTVKTLTVPVNASIVEICVETATARYTDDGITPTSSVGIPVAAGTCFAYSGPLDAFKIIGAGATMDVSYYK
jgi:hypothetical protein